MLYNYLFISIICTTNCTNILSIVFAVFITLLWVFTGHWLLLDGN